MRNILLVILLNFSLYAMSQNIAYLSDQNNKDSCTMYFDGNLFLTKGNMIFAEKYTNKESLNARMKLFYNDTKRNESYYIFNYSGSTPTHGWYLEDKYRHKTLHFSKQWILIKDNISNILLFKKSINCGMDVFEYSCKCGFSDAYYDFENGLFYFKKANFILQSETLMMLDISTGKLEKCKK